MTPLRVVPRRQAHRDFDSAFDYYLAKGAPDAAYQFADALDTAYATIAEHPGIGSRRHGEDLDIDGLRTWPVGSFPFLVFYFDQHDEIDVWRVLHMRRDVPLALEDRD